MGNREGKSGSGHGSGLCAGERQTAVARQANPGPLERSGPVLLDLGLPGKVSPVGIVHRPKVQGIDGAAVAHEAGAAIHTDFRDKFIRAETIAWDKLLEAGSWSKAREQGTLRTEGKTYIVQDGDVIEFLV